MPRAARLDTPGILQHVMIRGIERRKIFREDGDRQDLLDRLATLLPETGTGCYAWAFLDNHAHFLFRSGPRGIAVLMRRLLTGYVVGFNRRHRRCGQLFQNRYKSIVCQEDAYMKQLVAYIHLNPLRAGLVSDLDQLGDYPYCGHAAVLGRWPVFWQDVEFVLRQFGDSLKAARRHYLEYVARSAALGRQPELVSGSVARKARGWKKVHHGPPKGLDRRMSDSRILGEPAFVHSVLAEARQALDRGYLLRSQGWDLDRVLERAASVFDLPVPEVLRSGRQRPRALARSLACYWAVRELGLPSAELARRFGMTAAGVNYAVRRGERLAVERMLVLEG
jgi:REP element-mobilizing transposase RayT